MTSSSEFRPLPATHCLLVSRDGFTLFVTLNSPDVRNAMSAQAWRELGDIFDSIRDDCTIRVVVIRGAGGNFSAGGNTKERDEMATGSSGEQLIIERNSAGGKVLAKVDSAPQVVIAVVQGYALGGGLGLTCVADIVIADESAIFRLPEVTIGVIPAQIAPYLVRRVGMSQARRLALSAVAVRAAEAHNLGLVHLLCKDEVELNQAVAELLIDQDRCGPSAVAATKELLASVEAMDPTFVESAAHRFAAVYSSEEGQEGVRSMKERRKPKWCGGS